MQPELSKWRRAAQDRIRELLVVQGDVADLRKTLDKIDADIVHDIHKIDEALDNDGRDRSTKQARPGRGG